MAVAKQCGTCKHHEGKYCYRHPPIVVVVRGQLDTQHPCTQDTDHCSEWEKP